MSSASAPPSSSGTPAPPSNAPPSSSNGAPSAPEAPSNPAQGSTSGAGGTQGSGDTGVGCTGASCEPAPVPVPAPTCSDAVRNQDEAGVDCGGSACLPCPCTYGTPELLGDPNYPGNGLYSPTLSPDGLTLLFGLYVGTATETIAFSTRTAENQAFGLGNLLPGPIDASVEGTPRLAADNLTLYFYSERAGGLGGRDIYRAQRATPTANFDSITNLTEINSTALDHLPWVGVNQLSLYFTSDRAGNLDLYRSVRASITDPWGAPAPVSELNSTVLENGATLTADEREILFVSTRRGGLGDFFRAVRAPGETVFRAPEFLAELSSPDEDSDPALSADGTVLYFSSTRGGVDSRIWRVSRTCP